MTKTSKYFSFFLFPFVSSSRSMQLPDSFKSGCRNLNLLISTRKILALPRLELTTYRLQSELLNRCSMQLVLYRNTEYTIELYINRVFQLFHGFFSFVPPPGRVLFNLYAAELFWGSGSIAQIRGSQREVFSLMQGASGIFKKPGGIFRGILRKTVQVCYLLAEFRAAKFHQNIPCPRG